MSHFNSLEKNSTDFDLKSLLYSSWFSQIRLIVNTVASSSHASCPLSGAQGPADRDSSPEHGGGTLQSAPLPGTCTFPLWDHLHARVRRPQNRITGDFADENIKFLSCGNIGTVTVIGKNKISERTYTALGGTHVQTLKVYNCEKHTSYLAFVNHLTGQWNYRCLETTADVVVVVPILRSYWYRWSPWSEALSN